MNFIQRLTQKVLGPYSIFILLKMDLMKAVKVDLDDRVVAQDESTLKKRVPGFWSFCYSENGARLCTCSVWYGEQYKTRNFWPLKSDECKLISLETVAAAKGKGLAPLLIRQVTRHMAAMGFATIYARVWHSNNASLRALAKAGWTRHVIVIDIFPLGKRLRMIVPYRWLPWPRLR